MKVIPSADANNALVLGTAIHTGIEKGTAAGIQAYYDAFPVIDDSHINEVMKLEYLIPLVKAKLPEGGVFEQTIANTDFIGFIDYLVPVGDGEYDLYDFKYSNNQRTYMTSGQLHEYKWFYEQTHPKQKIRNLYFLFVPKVNIKQKKTEDLLAFRNRIQEELEQSEIKIVQVEFNSSKVVEFVMNIKRILECKEFEKEKGYLCTWCEYQEFCEKGVDYMLLPKNERRNIETINKKVVWLYGAPFSGKTFLANKFPEPLMLNTDGNIKFVDSPYLSIRDEVKVEGRQTRRTLAWQVFKDAIGELEKKENDFKTIVVDLLEDCYEHCRVFMYDKLNISHESDDSFSAWDKVRTEFLSTMKRLMNMEYDNIILISHEDRSKDITRKGGDKITSIKPNLQDKVANKMAGMVDIVARVVADGDERTLSFKTNEVIFGGGRLTVTKKEIPLDYKAFMDVYHEANGEAVNGGVIKDTETKVEPQTTGRTSRKPKSAETVAPPEADVAEAADVQEGETKEPEGDSVAQIVKENRTEGEEAAEEGATEQPKAEEAEPVTPPVRTRKRRGE